MKSLFLCFYLHIIYNVVWLQIKDRDQVKIWFYNFILFFIVIFSPIFLDVYAKDCYYILISVKYLKMYI